MKQPLRKRNCDDAKAEISKKGTFLEFRVTNKFNEIERINFQLVSFTEC